MNGKRFLVFDSGNNTKVKPISEYDLSRFILSTILKKETYSKILPIGGPGPALSAIEQGSLIFKAAKKPKKFLSIPSSLFRILIFLSSPIGVFSEKIRDFREFLKIALFYATESMLVWDEKKGKYMDSDTPEFGKDTLEEYYLKIFEKEHMAIERSDKRLFR